MRNVQKKTRSTIIDYRNGKYQGCVKRDTERRQGFGIVIDDDLSIYFSEWDDGKLNGLTFVYFVDGTYLYGNWRNNQPNGINIFKNSEFLLLANYHIGEPIGNAIVATTSMNYMFLLNSEQLIPKKSWYKYLIKIDSFRPITEKGYAEDIINDFAKNRGLSLQPYYLTFVKFLQEIQNRSSDEIVLMEDYGRLYFGFYEGLGFRFCHLGQSFHKFHLHSIGIHRKRKIAEFGAKFHYNRCIEYGNFYLKETITYNRLRNRPTDKTASIYQKLHKKSLNFLNEYFEMKLELFEEIDWYLKEKLVTASQYLIVAHYYKARQQSHSRKQEYYLTKQINNDPVELVTSRKRYYHEPNKEIVVKENNNRKVNKTTPVKQKYSFSGSNPQSSKSKIRAALEPIYSSKYFPEGRYAISRSKSVGKNQSHYTSSQKRQAIEKSPERRERHTDKAQPKYIKYFTAQKNHQDENGLYNQEFDNQRGELRYNRTSSNLMKVAREKYKVKYQIQRYNYLKIREYILKKEQGYSIIYARKYADQSLSTRQLLYARVRSPSDYTVKPSYEITEDKRLTEYLQARRYRILKEFREMNESPTPFVNSPTVSPFLVANEESSRRIKSRNDPLRNDQAWAEYSQRKVLEEDSINRQNTRYDFLYPKAEQIYRISHKYSHYYHPFAEEVRAEELRQHESRHPERSYCDYNYSDIRHLEGRLHYPLYTEYKEGPKYSNLKEGKYLGRRYYYAVSDRVFRQREGTSLREGPTSQLPTRRYEYYFNNS